METENVGFPEDLAAIEADVVNYIAGSVIRSLSNYKKRFDICEGCIELAINSTSDVSTSLTALKEYKPGALITVSNAVSDLCCKLEQCFQNVTKNGLPLPHPRKHIP